MGRRGATRPRIFLHNEANKKTGTKFPLLDKLHTLFDVYLSPGSGQLERARPSPALKGGRRLGVPHSSVLPSEQKKTAAMANGFSKPAPAGPPRSTHTPILSRN